MVAITAAFVTQPVRANVINSIVIAEESSKNLLVTYSNGSVSVNLSGPNDEWAVTFPSSVSFNENLVMTVWIEPENSGKVNAIGEPGTFSFGVFSDIINPGLTAVPDGNTVEDVGTDSSNGGTIFLTFDDVAAAAEAPDTGTTGSFLGLSLMGLTFLRRKFVLS
jgi:hypothetical protein